MVDIVVNHNGWSGPTSSVDYTKFRPFNDIKYYHNVCSVNYDNQTSIEDCWLGDNEVPLADLRTEDQVVLNEYSGWIKELVSNYSSKHYPIFHNGQSNAINGKGSKS